MKCFVIVQAQHAMICMCGPQSDSKLWQTLRKQFSFHKERWGEKVGHEKWKLLKKNIVIGVVNVLQYIVM